MSNSDMSIVLDVTSNITRLPNQMPMACQDHTFWMGEGDAEKRMKERGSFGMF